MICKFCNFNAKGYSAEQNGFWLEKDEPHIGEYALFRYEGDQDEGCVEMIEIKFCPMCGRKLEEHGK